MARTSGAEHVLIIDDDIVSREVLTFLLGDAAYVVQTVASGEAALAHLRHLAPTPDAILTDVQLPGLCGSELASALRQHCPHSTVLIAMSGSEPPASAIQFFDAFLLKPFHANDFEATLAHCRAKPGAPASPESAMPSHNSRTAGDSALASNHDMSAQTFQGQPGTPVLTPPAQPAAALDQRIFQQLRKTMPAKQVFQVYHLCIDDVRKRIASMRTLASANQSEPFIREAHAIKGGCGMLGASELYQMAATLEKAGLGALEPGDTTGINPLDELAAACDRLERILGTRT